MSPISVRTAGFAGLLLTVACASGGGPSAQASRDAQADVAFLADTPQALAVCAAEWVEKDEGFLRVPSPSTRPELLGAQQRFEMRRLDRPSTENFSQRSAQTTQALQTLDLPGVLIPRVANLSYVEDRKPAGPVTPMIRISYAAGWATYHAADTPDADRAEVLAWLESRAEADPSLSRAYRVAFERALGGPCS